MMNQINNFHLFDIVHINTSNRDYCYSGIIIAIVNSTVYVRNINGVFELVYLDQLSLPTEEERFLWKLAE